MDGCINCNTRDRDFLSSGYDMSFLWGNLEQLDLLFLFFVHYCFTPNCFSSRIIRGGSLPGVSAVFEMWSCIQKEMAGMLLDWLHAECISQVCGVKWSLKGGDTPIHIISLLPHLSTTSSFWTERNQGSCRAKWDFCTRLALKAKLWRSELVGGQRKKRAPRTWLRFFTGSWKIGCPETLVSLEHKSTFFGHELI